MELRRARAVKQEIEAIFATRGTGERRRRFAVGLAPATQTAQYAIAVRAESPGDVSEGELAIIRRQAAGEVGVHYTGAITPLSAAAVSMAKHLSIGSSVAHHRGTAGSLGFFARRASDGALGFVSNNHVLAAYDRGVDGDEILYPSPADGGQAPRDVIAHLSGPYPQLKRPKPRVDCAFARLLPGIAYDAVQLDRGRMLSRQLAAPETAPEVAKIGRTTGLTPGRITAFDLSGVAVDFSMGRLLYFERQIEIQSVDETPFASGGDSGSLVFSVPDCRPVGLLFATSASGTAYANAIDAVIEELGVSFV